MIREHELKVWPSYFAAIRSGAKRFEVRSTRDRDFAVGDTLILREWDPQAGRVIEDAGYTNDAIRCPVSYVMPGGRFGIDAGTAILGLGIAEFGHYYTDEFYPADAVNTIGERRPSVTAEPATPPRTDRE